MSEYEYHIEGQKFWCRDSTNDEDVVRSCRSEYVLPSMEGYEPGSFVVDIGAHLGAFTCWSAQKYRDCRIIAVEPIPENQVQFLKNIELNGLQDRVSLMRGAGWSKKEPTVVIPYGDESTESGRIHQWVGNACDVPKSTNKHIIAKTFSMAEILAGMDKVWCVKFDAENAEYPLLEEASIDDLLRCKFLIGEFHLGIERIREVLKGEFKEHKMDHPALFCFENPMAFRFL